MALSMWVKALMASLSQLYEYSALPHQWIIPAALLRKVRVVSLRVGARAQGPSAQKYNVLFWFPWLFNQHHLLP